MRRLLAGVLFLGVLACTPDHSRYDAAVQRLEGLDRQVDQQFAQMRAHNQLILNDSAWSDPAALLHEIKAARDDAGRVLASEAQIIAVEEEILGLDTLDQSPHTRVLYRMDLDAQKAKVAVFQITAEMYEKLLKEAERGRRDRFNELARIYAVGIERANARYRELDLARQQYQKTTVAGPPA